MMAATSDPLIHTVLLGVFGFALAVMDSNPFTIIEQLSPDDSTRGYFIGPPPPPPALARLTHVHPLPPPLPLAPPSAED